MGLKDFCVRLPPSEQRILELLANGATVADISEEFGVSRQSVYGQLHHARRVLDARTICHAVAIWIGFREGERTDRDSDQPYLTEEERVR